jgi:heme/copper-type cytochrome/quinol oxidase subunit 1
MGTTMSAFFQATSRSSVIVLPRAAPVVVRRVANYVVGHFHYVVAPGTLLTLFGASLTGIRK